MNIIIVAGGNGTRFGNLSVFPKLLLPCTEYNSILESHLHTFEGNEIYVIIHNKFYDMFTNYCRVNNINNIHIIKSYNANGSYNTIMSVYDELPHENLLFVWSDLIIKSIDIDSLTSNTIFTYNGNYRYEYADSIVSKVEKGGNIPGVYYIKELSKQDICEEEKDFIDFISDNIKNDDKFDARIIDSMIEYRDYDTYIKEYRNNKQNKSKTRFFNSITVKDDVLTKKCVDNKYKHLIQKEIEWYDKCPNKTVIPKIYKTDYENGVIEMEYLKDYIPLYEYVKEHKNNEKDIIEVYKNLLDVICKIGSDIYTILSFKEFTMDLYKEIVEKTLNRCENISDMLINYDREELESVLYKAFDTIVDMCSDYDYPNSKIWYSFGHGDINGSNALVNPETKDVKVIDPRGYFGETKMAVLMDYDMAKILYCLSGYDDFNNKPQIYLLDEPKELGVTNIVKTVMPIQNLDYILLYVIWIALAGYISQDILKANIAYEFGLKKLKEIVWEN